MHKYIKLKKGLESQRSSSFFIHLFVIGYIFSSTPFQMNMGGSKRAVSQVYTAGSTTPFGNLLLLGVAIKGFQMRRNEDLEDKRFLQDVRSYERKHVQRYKKARQEYKKAHPNKQPPIARPDYRKLKVDKVDKDSNSSTVVYVKLVKKDGAVIADGCEDIRYDSEAETYQCEYEVRTGSHPGSYVKLVKKDGAVIADGCEDIHYDSEAETYQCEYEVRTGSHPGSYVKLVKKDGTVIADGCEDIHYDSEAETYQCEYEVRTGSLSYVIVKKDGTVIVDRCTDIHYDSETETYQCEYEVRTGSRPGSRTKLVRGEDGLIISKDCSSGDFHYDDNLRAFYCGSNHGSGKFVFLSGEECKLTKQVDLVTLAFVCPSKWLDYSDRDRYYDDSILLSQTFMYLFPSGAHLKMKNFCLGIHRPGEYREIGVCSYRQETDSDYVHLKQAFSLKLEN